jgi:hypothetical protein
MELFRTISPNGGSISALAETRPPRFERHGYIVTPHTQTSFDPVHWSNPKVFDPSRYESAPTSDRIDEAKARQIGLAKCPFDRTAFDVKDGRAAAMHNSGSAPCSVWCKESRCPWRRRRVAPFGFGYRRCPGEQLTINAEDLLESVEGQDEFVKLSTLPIGTVADRPDDGHRRQCRIYAAGLEHPENACPGLDPGWKLVFRKGSCSGKKLDFDSIQSGRIKV